MPEPFATELLDRHDRTSFRCGTEALDRYFREQVTQDMRRRMARCYVLVESASGRVAGFYTISSASISSPDLPIEVTRRLPRYPSVPAVRIGRLAVDLEFRGKGLGSALLIDAIRRSLLAPPAVFAILVDAKDDSAVAFYQRHGFQSLATLPRSLFLPMATAEEALL